MVSRGASMPLKPSSRVTDSSIARICVFRESAVDSETQMTVQYCITPLRGPSLWWDSTPVHAPASSPLPRSHLYEGLRSEMSKCGNRVCMPKQGSFVRLRADFGRPDVLARLRLIGC